MQTKLEKGRYSTIFDDGYFKDAAERYLTTWSSWGYRWTYGYDWGTKLSPITSARFYD
jgi:hypothetical protein